MSKVTITPSHVNRLYASEGCVSARAQYVAGDIRIDADVEIPRMLGVDVDPAAELRRAAKSAVECAVAKLQALVDARFPHGSDSGKARFIVTGEKTPAQVTESEAQQAWRAAYEPVYERLFGDMGVSVPAHLRIEDIESRLRARVDGQTSLTRQLHGEPGWLVGGQLLPLESLLHLSEHALHTRIVCCLPSSR